MNAALDSILAERTRMYAGTEHPFDGSDLAPAFRPYWGTGTRVRVVGPWGTRTGRVGITTGWRPAFLLMHRTTDHGSSDVLSDRDVITAVKPAGARSYLPVVGR